MRPRTLLILSLILLALVGLLGYLHLSETHKRPEQLTTGPLFKGIPWEGVTLLEIHGPDGSTSLVREEGAWVVRERLGYPADFDKIRDLVRKVTRLEAGQAFPASPETRRRLALEDPEDPEAPKASKGILISFYGTGERPLARLLVGKVWQRKGEGGGFPEGNYIMKGEESQVLRATPYLGPLQTDPAAWLQGRLLDVAPERIQRIVCLDPESLKVRFLLERPEKGKDLLLKEPHREEPLDAGAVGRLAGALSSLRLQDVRKASEWTPSAVLEYTLFDETVYRIKTKALEPPSQGILIHLDAGVNQPPSSRKREEPDLEPWDFMIPRWKGEALAADLETLLRHPKAGQKKGENAR